MPGIFQGADEIDDLRLGSSQVDAVYQGGELVWPVAVIFVTDSVTDGEESDGRVTLTIPSSVETGDLMVVTGMFNNPAAGELDSPGWTTVFSGSSLLGWKIFDGVETTVLTVDASSRKTFGMCAFRGAVAGASSRDTGGTSVTCPNLTAAASGAAMFNCCGDTTSVGGIQIPDPPVDYTTIWYREFSFAVCHNAYQLDQSAGLVTSTPFLNTIDVTNTQRISLMIERS